MLIYQTLLYLPAQLIGPAFQFLAAVAWTHWLSPSEYGVLSLVIAAQELVFYLCLSWWSQYAIRYFISHQKAQSLARYQPTENGVLAISVLAQSLACCVTLALSDATIDASLIAATIVFTVTRSITAHLAERARASGRIGIYTLAQTTGPVLGTLLGLVAIESGDATATIVLASFALAQTLALPITWRLLGLGVAMRFDRGILLAALRYGGPLLIAAVITWFSVNGLRVVVDWFDGAAAVGLVSVGWSLGQRVSAVAAMLVTAAAYPLAVQRAVTHSRAAALRQLSQAGALLAGIIVPVTVGILMVNRSAVDLMIGADFRSLTVAILPIAVLSGAVRNLRTHFADQTFLLCERSEMSLMIAAVEAALTIPFCIAGLFAGGLVGACLGCLVAHVIAAAFTFILAVKRFHLPIPLAHLARIAVATAAMAAVLELVSWKSTGLGLALEVMTGALIYGGLIAAFYRRDIRTLIAERATRQPDTAPPVDMIKRVSP